MYRCYGDEEGLGRRRDGIEDDHYWFYFDDFHFWDYCLFRKLLRHHGLLFMQAMREYENDRLGMSHRLGHGGIISLTAMTYNGLRDQINFKFIWLHDG